jgi:CRP/FNR family transcriptional regulator, cyclic AMP receptor protein
MWCRRQPGDRLIKESTYRKPPHNMGCDATQEAKEHEVSTYDPDEYYELMARGRMPRERQTLTYDHDLYYDLLARGRTRRSFTAGEVIFHKGDEADCMYVIREGSIAVKDGEQVVATVSAPSLVGEMALIDSRPRSLTAVADKDVVLVKIPVRQFWLLVHETPYFAHLVMSIMAARLRGSGDAA